MSYKPYFRAVLPVFLILCAAMASCERVIDVDLNSASPKYVIEGTVTNLDLPHQVRVTQTKNFDEDNDFEGIENAEVTLSDSLGHSEELAHTDSGVYRGSDIAGEPGMRYSLSVNIGGETFTATSTMPEPVFFRRLLIDEVVFFGDTLKIPNATYQDPEGTDNYYRHVLYINGQKNSSIFVSSDELYDGNLQARELFYGNPDNGLETGDQIVVEMQTIDEQVYEYFSTLTQTINRSAASPANPTSNISGEALGYFSAHTVQARATDIE